MQQLLLTLTMNLLALECKHTFLSHHDRWPSCSVWHLHIERGDDGIYSQVQGKAEELKNGAGKTASQAADAAEQAGGAAGQVGSAAGQPGTSGSQPEAQADTQAANAEGAAAENSTNEQHGAGQGSKQGTDRAQGTGTKTGSASSGSLMERLRSMASVVQREVRSACLLLTQALAISPSDVEAKLPCCLTAAVGDWLGWTSGTQREGQLLKGLYQ